MSNEIENIWKRIERLEREIQDRKRVISDLKNQAEGLVAVQIKTQGPKPEKLIDARVLENSTSASMDENTLTSEKIEQLIVSEQYVLFPATDLTVCCLVLANRFCVIGQSACVDHENFDPEKGRKIARDDAKRKIWELEGYLLKNELYAKQLAKAQPTKK